MSIDHKELLKQIGQWHGTGQHKQIIDAIEALPRKEWGYELTCLLARAYNNQGVGGDEGSPALEKARTLLESVKQQGQEDPMWHFRLGYALYYLDRKEEALPRFKRAAKLNPDDADAPYYVKQCKMVVDRTVKDRKALTKRIQSMADSFADTFYYAEEDDLDYSIQSLEWVDQMLDDVMGFGWDGEELQNAIRTFGCYIFETARRNYGGEYRWLEGSGQPVLIAGLPDFCVELLAWHKVEARLRNGKEDNIPFFVSGYQEHIERGKKEKGYHVTLT